MLHEGVRAPPLNVHVIKYERGDAIHCRALWLKFDLFFSPS